MARIKLLPPSVAERIAAGEVIDRPAAVVRELIENALDAGAAEVRIEARGGGLRLIQVADDGCGIPADEIELAFRRHATSKLRELSDLERISSFGFRGEALPSIAAVAEVSVLSATEGETGVRCSFRAGLPLERIAASRSRGTTVTVRDLFSAMPARLKFMRGARAEAAQIGAVVRRYALARPDLRVSLSLEGHTAFRSDGGDLAEALAAAHGDPLLGALLPLDPVEIEGVRICGLVSAHSVTRATRAQVALFVNGRYVRPQRLLAAIEDGYRPFLPRGRHAIAAIFLRAPPADLDVNIHPAKLDVRLRQETAIVSALTEAVRRAYGRHPSAITARASLALDGRQRRLPGLQRRIGEGERPVWSEGATAGSGDSLPALRLVGQVHHALIVAEAEEGFYLIDQHRAHERIIYERMIQSGQAGRQALIEPAMLELPPAAAAQLIEQLPALESLGFACEEFGRDRFLLRAAPTIEGLEGIGALLPELLAEAALDREGWRDRLLASFACRAAIRKGRPLTPAEARDLVTRLGATNAPAVCPHGSPVLLHLPDGFLARQFNWG
ncbi:MAG TPA: DNA mismatch repair endonuclease MutL [Steroidobacteraceae bacterium]|nr:DNA mismatch repair endonuclease MutL [Steroidobacteraceae bacterium]